MKVTSILLPNSQIEYSVHRDGIPEPQVYILTRRSRAQYIKYTEMLSRTISGIV